MCVHGQNTELWNVAKAASMSMLMGSDHTTESRLSRRDGQLGHGTLAELAFHEESLRATLCEDLKSRLSGGKHYPCKLLTHCPRIFGGAASHSRVTIINGLRRYDSLRYTPEWHRCWRLLLCAKTMLHASRRVRARVCPFTKHPDAPQRTTW